MVLSKGPEGEEYHNTPLAVYTAYPGKEGETEDGETYKITRTWIGDIAVGTEVTLEGVVLCERGDDWGMGSVRVGLVLPATYPGIKEV